MPRLRCGQPTKNGKTCKKVGDCHFHSTKKGGAKSLSPKKRSVKSRSTLVKSAPGKLEHKSYPLNKNSQLHVAAKTNNTKEVKLLIDNGAHVNLKNNDGNTPLHYAAMNGNAEIVKLLIRNGAYIHVKNKYKKTPLSMATDPKIIKLLSRKKTTILLTASDPSVLKKRDYGSKKIYKQRSPIKSRTIKSSSSGLQNYVPKTKDIMEASLMNNINDVKYYIDSGANINIKNKYGETALIFSANQDNKIIKMLIDAGAKLNLRTMVGHTALMAAITGEITKNVKILIGAGAKLNLRNTDDDTALLFAVDHNYKEIAKMLIDAGAKLNLKVKKNGYTALMSAVRKNNKEIVEMLIKAGANLNLQNKADETALIFSAYQDNKEIVEMLIKAGANLNLQNKNGSTALTLAAHKDYKDIAKLLIISGAAIDDKARSYPFINQYFDKYKNIIKLGKYRKLKKLPIDKKNITRWQYICSIIDKEYKIVKLRKIAKSVGIKIKKSDGTYLTKRELCVKLAKDLKYHKDLKQVKPSIRKTKRGDCRNEQTIGLTNIYNIPKNRFIKDKETSYCFDILELKDIMKGNRHNPYTTIRFSQKFRDKYNELLPAAKSKKPRVTVHKKKKLKVKPKSPTQQIKDIIKEKLHKMSDEYPNLPFNKIMNSSLSTLKDLTVFLKDTIPIQIRPIDNKWAYLLELLNMLERYETSIVAHTISTFYETN